MRMKFNRKFNSPASGLRVREICWRDLLKGPVERAEPASVWCGDLGRIIDARGCSTSIPAF